MLNKKNTKTYKMKDYDQEIQEIEDFHSAQNYGLFETLEEILNNN
jgi:hypothetical protein